MVRGMGQEKSNIDAMEVIAEEPTVTPATVQSIVDNAVRTSVQKQTASLRKLLSHPKGKGGGTPSPKESTPQKKKQTQAKKQESKKDGTPKSILKRKRGQPRVEFAEGTKQGSENKRKGNGRGSSNKKRHKQSRN